MKKRLVATALICFLLASLLVGCGNKQKAGPKGTTIREFVPQEPYAEQNQPTLQLEKTVLYRGEQLHISWENAEDDHKIFVLQEGVCPDGVAEVLWESVVAEGDPGFNTQYMQRGYYNVFLCDHDGIYVHDVETIRIYDPEETQDMGVRQASLRTDEHGGMAIDITPAYNAVNQLEYRLYWSKDGAPLEDYTYLHSCIQMSGAPFSVTLNQGLVMPQEANGVTITVSYGLSTDYFLELPEELHVAEETPRYQFNVLSDIHVTQSSTKTNNFLKKAFTDIIAQGYSSMIFTVGDNTDQGTAKEYDRLKKLIANAGTRLPNIYYTMGNHDIVYNSNAGFDNQLALFREKLDMPGAYYAVEVNGVRNIILGSDTLSHLGTIGKDQQAWMKRELAKADPSEPIFIYLHQPLKDTVSGTLYTKYNKSDAQDSFGFLTDTEALRKILKDYPNAIVFTGHTHYSFLSEQPVLLGEGQDASFVACSSVGKARGGGLSEGLYVAVYDDYVLLRGRDFGSGKWSAPMQIKIPLYQ